MSIRAPRVIAALISGLSLILVSNGPTAAARPPASPVDPPDSDAAAAATVLEGEALLPPVTASAPVVSQANCCGVQWSGGRQAWFQFAGGDQATLRLSVPTTGQYELSAAMTQAPDYGDVRIAVDQVALGQPYAGYHPSARVVDAFFGRLELTAGTHELTLSVTSKDSRSRGFAAGLDRLELTQVDGAVGVRQTPYEQSGAEVSAGTFTNVYDPSVGESGPWYYNDHTLIQNRQTGQWHVFAITHAEPANPLDEKFFGHATAPSPRGPWTKQPFALQAEASKGESHIWAPHVIFHNGLYYLYYAAGTPDHAAYRMHLATSPDLRTWTKSTANPLFTDGFDARDPMIVRIGEQWVMYYTANGTPSGGTHQVAYRTSTDLRAWSAKKVAFQHELAGTFGGPTESPYVIKRGDWWYLFVCCDANYTDTRVYRSKDPLRFQQTDLAGRIRSHAAEVVTEADGTQWVTSAGWGQAGLSIAPLIFTEDEPVARGVVLENGRQRLDVRTWPQTSVRSYGVDPTGGGQYRQVSDGSARATAPYLGVGKFGVTDAAGPANTASSPSGDRLYLRAMPLGDERVTADLLVTMGRTSTDLNLIWNVNGTTRALVWETGMGFDGMSLDSRGRVGDPGAADRDGDVTGFPRWSLSTSSPAGSFAVAHRFASAWSGANTWYRRDHGYVSWQSLWKSGGQSWPAGTYAGGHWRLAGSQTTADSALAARLHAELNP